jgi:hypothetical protein
MTYSSRRQSNVGKSAGSAFLAKAAVAVLLAAMLACCTVYDVRMRERQHDEDAQACTGSGYKPGTNEFAKCLQDHDLTRMRATLLDGGSKTCTPAAGATTCN